MVKHNQDLQKGKTDVPGDTSGNEKSDKDENSKGVGEKNSYIRSLHVLHNMKLKNSDQKYFLQFQLKLLFGMI